MSRNYIPVSIAILLSGCALPPMPEDYSREQAQRGAKNNICFDAEYISIEQFNDGWDLIDRGFASYQAVDPDYMVELMYEEADKLIEGNVNVRTMCNRFAAEIDHEMRVIRRQKEARIAQEEAAKEFSEAIESSRPRTTTTNCSQMSNGTVSCRTNSW